MRQLPLIVAGILMYCSCNESSHETATKQTNTNDSDVQNRVSEPTPGLGYDPTRNNDDPFRNQEAVDSTGPVNKDKPTPGLGNYPIPNDP